MKKHFRAVLNPTEEIIVSAMMMMIRTLGQRTRIVVNVRKINLLNAKLQHKPAIVLLQHRFYTESRSISHPVPPMSPPPTPPPSTISEIIELLHTMQETAHALALAAPIVNVTLILGCGLYVVYRVGRYVRNVRSGVNLVKKTVEQSTEKAKEVVQSGINEANAVVKTASTAVQSASIKAEEVKRAIESNAKGVVQVGQESIGKVQNSLHDTVNFTTQTVEESKKKVVDGIHAVQSNVHNQFVKAHQTVEYASRQLENTNQAVKQELEQVTTKLTQQSKYATEKVKSISDTVNNTLDEVKHVDISKKVQQTTSDLLGSFWKKKNDEK